MSAQSPPPPPPPRNHSLPTTQASLSILVNDRNTEARGLMPFLSSDVAFRRDSDAQGRYADDDDKTSDDDSARTSLPFQPTAVHKSSVSTKNVVARSGKETSSLKAKPPSASGLPDRPPKPASEPILQARESQDDAPDFLAPPPPPRRPSLPAGVDRESQSTPGSPPSSSRRSPSPRPNIAITSATNTAPEMKQMSSRDKTLPKKASKPPLPPPSVAQAEADSKDRAGLFKTSSSSKSQPEVAARGQVSSGSLWHAAGSPGYVGAGPAVGTKSGSQSQPPATIPPPPPRPPARDPLPDASRISLVDVTDASETQLSPHSESSDITALASQLLANTSRPYALPMPVEQRFQHHLVSGASPLVLANISHSHSYPDFCSGMGLEEVNRAALQHLHQQHDLQEAQDQEHDDEIRKLLRINLIMRVVFWLLVSLCGALAIAYMVLIGFFFRSVPQGKTCVEKDELRQAVTRWSPNEQKRVYDYLPDRFESTPTQFCFETLDWVPKTMSNIYADVIDTVDYIKDKQLEINQTINVNNNPSLPTTQPSAATGKIPVYAHFSLNVEESAKGQAEITVLKLNNASVESTAYGVTFTQSTGEIKILHNGFYFLYSYVVFKDNISPKHEVIKKQMSKTEKLQEAQGEATSALQGVFRLHKGDSVYVQASRSQLDASGSMGSYFGLYLVRT